MAINLRLGARPKAFAPVTIKFVGPDGQELVIPGVVYKYRTRREYGQFLEKHNSAEGYKPAEGEKFDLGKLFEKANSQSVDRLLDSIESWGLDQPVDRETLDQLCDELPAGSIALNEGYTLAARDGRLGN